MRRPRDARPCGTVDAQLQFARLAAIDRDSPQRTAAITIGRVHQFVVRSPVEAEDDPIVVSDSSGLAAADGREINVVDVAAVDGAIECNVLTVWREDRRSI